MKYLWLLLFSCVAVSCSKTLHEEPRSTASKEAVFGSERGLDLYANSFYDNLPTANDMVRGDEMSDYAARTQVPDFLLEGAFGRRPRAS